MVEQGKGGWRGVGGRWIGDVRWMGGEDWAFIGPNPGRKQACCSLGEALYEGMLVTKG
jgi:hypothetical protein